MTKHAFVIGASFVGHSSLTPMPTFEGDFSPPAGRFAIVAARFNSIVVDALLVGALDALKRHGVPDDRVDVIRVPGSFEVPPIAQRLGSSKKYAAVICLGAVIKGDTDHYDHVANSATSGIAQAAMTCNIPIVFGILTCESLEQALNRAGGKSGNKGFEAAVTAIEMVSLIKKIG